MAIFPFICMYINLYKDKYVYIYMNIFVNILNTYLYMLIYVCKFDTCAQGCPCSRCLQLEVLWFRVSGQISLDLLSLLVCSVDLDFWPGLSSGLTCSLLLLLPRPVHLLRTLSHLLLLPQEVGYLHAQPPRRRR